MRLFPVLALPVLLVFSFLGGEMISTAQNAPRQTAAPAERHQTVQPPAPQNAPPAEQPQGAESCVECHSRITPGIVVDWKLSKHSANDVGCSTCHGDGHQSMTDVSNAKMVLPEKCGTCHETQVEQFSRGKHALAWAAMKAMPTLHYQPMAQIEGLKGCGGCHRVGTKTEGEVRDLVDKGSAFGVSSCDVCHTRHLFSVDEARSPQACRTCHMGTDHPQWEMYSASKHGVRFLLKQSRMLPEEVAAPTCQSCHLREGDHANRTAWGYLAVRMPLPADPQWQRDRTTILQAFGILDPSGKPTPRAEAVQALDMVRLTDEDWQAERQKMLQVCNDCHSINFARSELEKGDRMVRESDRLLAEAITTVAGLYQEGVLKKPQNYSYPFPDLLALHDAPTVIEQKLFKMFHEYRMRTFQGAFHANPDYTFWYGWASMQSCLTEIREKAAEMSCKAAADKAGTSPPAKK